jgi:type VI secretion system protein VasD
MENIKIWFVKYKLTLGILSMIAGLLIFSGCSSVKQININLQGTREMNNGGNPVLVYICQLKNDTVFKDAAYDIFWQGDDKPFSKEVIEAITKKLYPDSMETLDLNIRSETRFIGIAAAFFEPDTEDWRRIYPLTSKRPKQIVIVVGPNKIDIQY